ncbi:MAG: hypothetical protein HZA61_13740 [Candidatus Eisenbacteria bacterium]|uniref:Cytochrome c-552/4 domain-containing protein n=1 Tax=Eiseniibacteriota bacterium TaxID=2212470 RepID=A0A933W2X5_UNCEI|nr:hypothetical protein [Candidatus Eisenbacteria bacterium]
MPRRTRLALFAAAVLVGTAGIAAAIPPLGDHVVLSWNDLGMHCMNQWSADFMVLPPFNNLQAQVIRRGSATSKPYLLVSGVDLEYSIPGNTTSMGKTDFWTYAPAIFGVTLPPDVGLTGKGLTGTLDPAGGSMYEAKGIPITPFDDAQPTVEKPYQRALVIARDTQGHELARSTPVIPVSIEVNCVSSGCHASINGILNGHPRVAGFDPNVRPILCAKCHASPALGTAGRPEARYFSFQIHDRHQFLDQQMSGVDLCNKCHPGPKTQCLRGAMSQRHALSCQSCHGNMAAMASSIENGRVPWANEPSCGTCHGAAYAEQPGKLYRMSTGHGGVACEACHGSTHADFPSREENDNANNVALQGYAGTLRECAVCHGDGVPQGGGPHVASTAGVGDELLASAARLSVSPNPVRQACSFGAGATPGVSGRLLVHDAQGRIVRMLEATPASARVVLAWDGRDARGVRVGPGTYFARWQQDGRTSAARVTVVR